MLSLTANWLAAFQRGTIAPVVFLATIDVGGGTTFTARRGWSTDATIASYPESLATMSQVAATMDPFTRVPQVSKVELTFANDGWLKTIAIANRLKGKGLTLTFGTQALATADFAPYFKGDIDQVLPQRDGTVLVRCSSALGRLRDQPIVGYWPPQHPLLAIKDVYGKAGVSSALYDATALDPSLAAYATISHWVIQRGALQINGVDNAVRTPTPATQLLGELAQLLDGQNIEHEDGVLSFKVFDSTAAAADTWTDDDLEIDALEVLDLEANAYNRIAVAFCRSDSSNPSGFEARYQQDDTASQSALAYPGDTSRVLQQLFTSSWLDSIGALYTGMTATSPAVGETFQVASHPATFAGSYWPGYTHDSPPAQPSYAQLNSAAGRTAYLKIDDELVEVDLVTFSDATSSYVIDPATGLQVNTGLFPELATYRVKTRGALGTTADTHVAQGGTTSLAYVFDATIPVAMVTARLKRWSYGASIIRVPTHLGKYGVQLGDLVKLSSSVNAYFRFGQSSLDGTEKWEVVGKEPDLDAGHITWTLCWAGSNAPTTQHKLVPHTPLNGMRSQGKNALDATLSVAKVTSGLVVTAPSFGLVASVSPGTAVQGDVWRYELKSAASVTLAASKDNYVILNIKSAAISVRAVVIGSASPTAGPGEVILGKVTTGGATVTSTRTAVIPTTTRSTKPSSGAALAPNLVSPLSITTKGASQTSLSPNPFLVHRTRG